MAPAPRMLFSWDDVETRPELQRLALALDALPDDALLTELGKRRGAGRNDFPVAAMWRAVIAGIVFQHASVESLLRELNRNPALLDLCGFNPLPVHRRGEVGRIADTVPNGWNVSRFLKTLVDIEEEQGLVSAFGLETLVATPRRNRFPDVGAGARMSAGLGRRTIVRAAMQSR